MEALSGCAEEDLLTMGVVKLGHRKKLIKSHPHPDRHTLTQTDCFRVWGLGFRNPDASAKLGHRKKLIKSHPHPTLESS